MHNKIIYLLLISILIFPVLGITDVKASEVKLLCLSNGQTIKFSECNPAIPDRTCTSSQGCQFCVTYTDSGVYCPANLNICNAIEEISCSQPLNTNVTSSNIDSAENQNNRPGNLSGIGTVRADIAYIIKDFLGVDSDLIAEIRNDGYTFEIIYESDVPRIDLSRYYIVLVGNQRLVNPQEIPVHKHKSIIINSYNYYLRGSDQQFGWSRYQGSISSPTILTVQDQIHPIVASLPRSFNSYNVREPSVTTSILKGNKPAGVDIIISSGSIANAVVAVLYPGKVYLNSKVAEERAVYFGITKTKFWSGETKRLFKNSLDWLIEGVDIDRDGYFTDSDCNDRNPTIRPGASEIPYDNIDQDCNGSDLNDLDQDGFPSQRVGGKDCNDNDPTVNPTNQNPTLNCINDRPTFLRMVEDINWNEDTAFSLDLSNYFSDPDSILTYTVSGSNNITIRVSNSIAYFSQPKDWFGLEKIVFTANDGEFTVRSNEIILKVLERGEPPVLAKLSCLTEINEDEVHSCTLEATDFENNPFIFSIGRESKLDCSINGNILSYVSKPNYNGIAYCEIIVSDQHGSDSKILSVKVLPINDPPIIKSYTPNKPLIKIPEILNRTFSIEAEDPEGNMSISWFLDNVLQSEGTSYTFKNTLGIHSLRAVVSDSLFHIENFWNIIVGASSEFTCYEISGRLCSEKYTCPESLVSTSDSNKCCISECVKLPQTFKDANGCESVSDSINIDIKSPKSSDKLKIGDILNVELSIKNNLSVSQDLHLQVNLYDIDREKSVSEAKSKINLAENEEKIVELDLEIPEELDLDKNYVLFVKAEDDECNQKYIELNLDRPTEKLTISEYEVPERAVCGETILVKAKLENLGSSDQEVSLSLNNGELKINKETEKFIIEQYGEKYKTTKEFSFEIPENTGAGNYKITATLIGKESISRSKTLLVGDCKTKEKIENIQSQGKIKLESGITKESYQGGNNLLIIALTALTSLIATAFLLFSYKIARDSR